MHICNYALCRTNGEVGGEGAVCSKECLCNYDLYVNAIMHLMHYEWEGVGVKEQEQSVQRNAALCNHVINSLKFEFLIVSKTIVLDNSG